MRKAYFCRNSKTTGLPKKMRIHKNFNCDFDEKAINFKLQPHIIQFMEDHSPEFQLFLSIFSKLMAFPRYVPNIHNFVASISFRFLLSGHVNSKNNVFGGLKVPDEVLQTTLHFVECTAWVAMNKLGIIGPYWFEDDDDRSQTVNKGRYMAVLN